MRGLELRDLEILRALLRVRYLTTRQINDVFFSCARVGRRRIHRLSDQNLIKPHSKGLPQVWRYTAWRLTSRGLEAIVDAFPDEPIPDGVIERVAEGSLHNFAHRDALSQLYLELVVPRRDDLAEDADRSAHRAWAAKLRARASQIEWQPDGDVILRYQYLSTKDYIVPDATVVCRSQGLRVFVELDRSTKSLPRIAKTLQQYYRFVGTGTHKTALPDGLTPRLLFVVRSQARRENIEALVRKQYGEVSICRVRREDEAVAWLARKFFSETSAAPAPAPDPLREAAKDAYLWAVDFLDGEVRKGSLVEIEKTHAPILNEGRKRLRRLYDALTTGRSGS